MKTCKRCKEAKPVAEFYLNNQGQTLETICKVCKKEKAKETYSMKRWARGYRKCVEEGCELIVAPHHTGKCREHRKKIVTKRCTDCMEMFTPSHRSTHVRCAECRKKDNRGNWKRA